MTRTINSNFLNMLQDVEAFHKKFNLPITPYGSIIPKKTKSQYVKFRKEFLLEELNEAINATTLDDFIDAHLDLMYVALGTFLYFGLQMEDEIEIDTDIFPQFKLSEVKQKRYCHIDAAIQHAIVEQFQDTEENIVLCRSVLIYIVAMSESVIGALGFTPDIVKAMWDKLQAANMAKIPATLENPSTRGNTSGDMVKPDGWVAPSYTEFFKL